MRHYLVQKSSKIWTGLSKRSMLLTVNISSSLAFRRASRRCRTTRNAILSWSYTRSDNTRCASQQNAVGLSSAGATRCAYPQCAGVPLFAKWELFSAILGALSPKSAASFLQNPQFSPPQYTFRFSAICVPPLRNTRSASPQYVFCLSAIHLPPLRNTPSASAQ